MARNPEGPAAPAERSKQTSAMDFLFSAAGEDPLQRVARWGILASTLVCWAILVLGSLHLLTGWSIVASTLALVLLLGWVITSSPAGPSFSLPSWPSWPAILWLTCLTLLFLPTPAANWDAMTYHLFLPARWLQEGAIVPVPTVFGDDSAAFAPQNGALIFTWAMGLLGSDWITNIVQVPALALLAAALGILARRLGVSRLPAAMALSSLPFFLVVERWTFSANVDIFLTAFWVAALAFLFGEGRPNDLFYGGLALGLTLGIKTLGLPLAVGTLVVAAPRLYRLPRRDLMLFAAATCSTGSFWWLRNFWLYGNPLFPLDVSLGSWRLLPGVFSSATARQSAFHIEGWKDWAIEILQTWGNLTCTVVILGLVFLLWSARRLELELALLAFGWMAFVFRIVPHNNQSRFLLPVLALSLLGLARLFERIPWRALRVIFWLLLLFSLVHPLQQKSFPQRQWTALSSQLDFRSAAFAHAEYPMWSSGFLPFNAPNTPPQRIAYVGGNIPYTLVGEGIRNHVVYCNVQGERTDGLWDFWSRDPRLRSAFLSGIYRGQENVDTWLACLDAEAIQIVVLFRMLPGSEPEGWQKDGDFLVERRWMRERPERFRQLKKTDWIEIWGVQR